MAIRRFQITEDLSSKINAGYTILTPTHRISTALLECLAENINSNSWLKPNVTPIDLWIKKKWRELANLSISPCCDYEILNGTEEHLLWSLCIEASSEDYPLINTQETARLASKAHQELNLFANPAELKKIFASAKNRNFTLFSHWREDFLRRTEVIKALPLSTALVKLTVLLKEKPDHIKENLVLINFYDPPPSYKMLFETLQDSNSVENYVSSGSPSSKISIKNQAIETPQRINEFTSHKDEINECAKWIQSVLKNDPNAHIGVITPNPQSVESNLQREVLRQLQRERTSFLGSIINTSNQTRAFKSDGIIYGILYALKILEEDKVETQSFCQFLRTPFLRGSAEELESRLNLELFLREKRSHFCSISQQIIFLNDKERKFYSPKLVDALITSKNIIKRNKHSKTPFELSHVFRKISDILFPELAILSQYTSIQLETFTKSAQQLARLTPITGNLTYKKALTHLWLFCSDESKKRPYNKNSQISLYTPNDAVGLSYTYTWFLSFNDISYPEQLPKNPFLPTKYTEEHTNPEILVKKSEQTVRNIFDSTTASIKLSYATQDDELTQKPSQLLGSLQVSRTTVNKQKKLNHCELEIINDSGFVKLKENEAVTGGSRLITDQAQCPFQAFAKHRLHVSELQKFTLGISPAERGTSLHIGLDYLFKKIRSKQQIEKISNVNKKQIINDAASMSIKYLRSHSPLVVTPNFEATERERLRVLFEAFLSMEQQRHPFKVIESEKECFLRVADLDLRLRIDRIDEIENDELILIDYKSGSTTPSLRPETWQVKRSDNFQLPLYFFAYRTTSKKDVSGLVFAQVNSKEVKYNTLLTSEICNEKPKIISREQWSELQQRWEADIYSLAKEFKDGVVHVDPIPKPNVCTNCKLHSLCRIKEKEQLHSSSYSGQEDA